MLLRLLYHLLLCITSQNLAHPHHGSVFAKYRWTLYTLSYYSLYHVRYFGASRFHMSLYVCVCLSITTNNLYVCVCPLRQTFDGLPRYFRCVLPPPNFHPHCSLLQVSLVCEPTRNLGLYTCNTHV